MPDYPLGYTEPFMPETDIVSEDSRDLGAEASNSDEAQLCHSLVLSEPQQQINAVMPNIIKLLQEQGYKESSIIISEAWDKIINSRSVSYDTWKKGLIKSCKTIAALNEINRYKINAQKKDVAEFVGSFGDEYDDNDKQQFCDIINQFLLTKQEQDLRFGYEPAFNRNSVLNLLNYHFSTTTYGRVLQEAADDIMKLLNQGTTDERSVASKDA